MTSVPLTGYTQPWRAEPLTRAPVLSPQPWREAKLPAQPVLGPWSVALIVRSSRSRRQMWKDMRLHMSLALSGQVTPSLRAFG